MSLGVPEDIPRGRDVRHHDYLLDGQYLCMDHDVCNTSLGLLVKVIIKDFCQVEVVPHGSWRREVTKGFMASSSASMAQGNPHMHSIRTLHGPTRLRVGQARQGIGW